VHQSAYDRNVPLHLHGILPPPRNTCLFTGEVLTSDTYEEHTIPRGVCGRTRSRLVSSDVFNNRAGSGIDRALVGAYLPLFNRLAPLLSSEHQPAPLPAEIPGGEGKFHFVGGRLMRNGMWIEPDEKTGRPVAANASDAEAVRRFFRRQPGGATKSYPVTLVPVSDSTVASTTHYALTVETELAALKALLLTFDHLLYSCPRRFTRSPHLAPVLELVRQGVQAEPLNSSLYDSIVMGLQYEKLPEVEKLRLDLPISRTPFEHVMVVSGNSAEQTLDAIWCVAGIDPYGFRLSRSWTEYSFTLVFVSGVLRGTTAQHFSQPFDFTCSYKPRQRAKTQPIDAKTIAEIIAANHSRALEASVDLVERGCRDYVLECIVEAARYGFANGSGGRIKDAMVRRLEGFFKHQLTDPKLKCRFNRTIARHMSRLSRTVREEAVTGIEETPLLSRNRWFAAQLSILDDLRDWLGTPGRGQIESEVIIESTKGATGSQPCR
jgi:hypothetical protein